MKCKHTSCFPVRIYLGKGEGLKRKRHTNYTSMIHFLYSEKRRSGNNQSKECKIHSFKHKPLEVSLEILKRRKK